MDALTLRQMEENTANQYFKPIDLSMIPVSALSSNTIRHIAISLNRRKILLSENGDFRDWRGLAGRIGLDNSYHQMLSADSDPTKRVINIWGEKPLEYANLQRFQYILGLIDRWDIVDDTNDMFLNDARIHLIKDDRKRNELLPRSDNESVFVLNDMENTIIVKDDLESERYGLPRVKYDAFVLYADEDMGFASDLVEKMEYNGFKLCLKARDLIAGTQFPHEVIMHLISVRCNRLIIIVSKAFLRSPENNFFVNYTQALGIEQGKNKIIPCLYEHCDLPQTLKIYFILNYMRSGVLYNFWDKLRETLETAQLQTNRIPFNNRPRHLALKGSSNHNQTQHQQIYTVTLTNEERNRRRNEELTLMKIKDREIIEDLNNSVKIHLSSPSSESCRIHEIEDLPSPPTTPLTISPPISTTTSKLKSSKSMLDLKFLKPSNKKSNKFSKSQSNLNQIDTVSLSPYEDDVDTCGIQIMENDGFSSSITSKKHSSNSLKHSKLFKWLQKKDPGKEKGSKGIGPDNISVIKVEKPKKKKKNIFSQMLKEKEKA